MKRLYQNVFSQLLEEQRQMLFVMGPRQVGKTTTAIQIGQQAGLSHYWNWDNFEQRALIVEGPDAVATKSSLLELTKLQPLLIFDEIHKYSHWKDFLKGLYDSYPKRAKILVTGSARLDTFRRGGDSLMGRYFSFHFHPLSVAELVDQAVPQAALRSVPLPLPKDTFEALWKFGGYPDPFLQQNERFYNRWKRLRFMQMLDGDVRDLTRVQEIAQLQLLADLLAHQIGKESTYDSLSKKVRVSVNTIRNWMEILKSLYYLFEVRPWSKNIARSLLKEPKFYLWDWSLVQDEGARVENFVAAHLLKAVHFWTDYGFGEYGLFYIKDKEQREVDFVITKDDEPWMLIEVKQGLTSLSPALVHFYHQTKAQYALQLSFQMPYVDKNCFSDSGPIIVPILTFLSQLV